MHLGWENKRGGGGQIHRERGARGIVTGLIQQTNAVRAFRAAYKLQNGQVNAGETTQKLIINDKFQAHATKQC